MNNDLMPPPIRELIPANLPHPRNRVPLLAPLRKDVASIGPAWLPVALVLGAIAAVAYVDHRVVSISLVYLYIFPLGISAILLRKELTYSLVPVCVLVHDYWSPRVIHRAHAKKVMDYAALRSDLRSQKS